jgi:hypothetical protein
VVVEEARKKAMMSQAMRQWVEYRAPLSRSLRAIGFGAEPVFSHADRAWFMRRGNQIFRYGLGAPVDDAALAISSYFSSNPCSSGSIQVVTDFQNQYNATNPGSPLDVDGKYGVSTQAAVQATFDAAGAGVAPAACFDASGNYIGASSSGGGGGTTTPVATTSSTSSFFTTYPYAKPILIGTAALATGFVGYKVLSKHKRKHHRR